ncbi:hypothetical protein MMC11_003590 [Xylographa trunciseda]|nr:hypothetical protein [Xylographa trunciseda]
MATLDGISVRIVANGDSLPFYGGPAAENEPSAADTRTRNYYVEAVDGASFALELRATEDWEARAGNGLVFTFSFDGGAGFVMPMAVAERRGRGEVVVGNGVRGVPAYDGAEGEWRRVGLGFGRLDTVEGDGGGGGGFAGDVRELGTIRVSARRAVLRKFKTYAVGGREGWRGVGRVSERDLKGMAVTNAVT